MIKLIQAGRCKNAAHEPPVLISHCISGYVMVPEIDPLPYKRRAETNDSKLDIGIDETSSDEPRAINSQEVLSSPEIWRAFITDKRFYIFSAQLLMGNIYSVNTYYD